MSDDSLRCKYYVVCNILGRIKFIIISPLLFQKNININSPPSTGNRIPAFLFQSHDNLGVSVSLCLCVLVPQVLVLELETRLQRERERLGELRKKHYELAGAAEGWGEEEGEGENAQRVT